MILGIDFSPLGIIEALVTNLFAAIVSAITAPIQGFFDNLFTTIFGGGDSLV